MRLFLAVIAALLAISIVSPVKWLCGRQEEAYGQFPGVYPVSPRDLTQYDLVQAAYADQIKKLYALLYEGYLTRPGKRKEEDEKFMRGLRMARTARRAAQEMMFREPWEIIAPLGRDREDLWEQKPEVPAEESR